MKILKTLFNFWFRFLMIVVGIVLVVLGGVSLMTTTIPGIILIMFAFMGKEGIKAVRDII